MQVWLKNRIVGEANLSPRPGAREIVVNIMDDPLPSFSARLDASTPCPFPTVERLVLRMGKRAVSIEDREACMGGPDAVAHILRLNKVDPATVEKTENNNLCTTTYSWNVIVVDVDLLDRIFDMDWFTPADSEPDREEMMRRMDEKRMDGIFGL
jgi:hypothetical protein